VNFVLFIKGMSTSDTSDEIKPANLEEEKSDAPEAKKVLTKEEQMAAFEKAMKEEDWGHQPC